jgi:hypothetical protein
MGQGIRIFPSRDLISAEVANAQESLTDLLTFLTLVLEPLRMRTNPDW